MKRFISVLLILSLMFTLTSCSLKMDASPEIVQMRNICELATIKCYYRNVAKYYEEKAEVFLWSEKHRKFWIEYSGVISIGIDASLVELEINDNIVTIAIPPAKVLDCKIEELSKDSFIIDESGAEVKAEHTTKAIADAQENMKKEASMNKTLLDNAQQRVKDLLEDYVKNIGELVDKEYTVEFVDINSDSEKITSDGSNMVTT